MLRNKLILSTAMIFLVLIISFVLAEHVVTTSAGTTSYVVVEEITNLYNITVNNSDTAATANITQVNITIPSTFNFTTGTQTSGVAATFVNTSTVLSWSNYSDYLINASEITNFTFNATANNQGPFNITIATVNASGIFESNISVDSRFQRFGVTKNINTINGTRNTLINFSIISEHGGNSNITNVTITLPQNNMILVTGSNSSTATASFTNTSNVLNWDTGATGFEWGTTEDFLLNVTGKLAASATILVNLTRADSLYNYSSEAIAVNFVFEGYVKNDSGDLMNATNLTIYRYIMGANGPPTEAYESSVLTDANGAFSFPSVNGSATNYLLKIIQYNASGYATGVGTTLPAFPGMMYYPISSGMDMTLNGTTFYIQPAATIRLYAHNYTGATKGLQQTFGYEVIDQKVGFPIESNIMQSVSTKDIIVPAGRDYSVMLLREFSQFTNYGPLVCNGSFFNDTACPSPPVSNSSLGTISAGDIIVVNQSLVVSEYRLYGCVNIGAGHNNSKLNVTNIKLKMVPWTTSSGIFIPPMDASQGKLNVSDVNQLNNSNMSGGVQCPGGLASYNISVLGSTSGITYLVQVFAKNASDEAGNPGPAWNLGAIVNLTITNHTNLNLTLYKLLGNYVNNQNDVNTSKVQINIQNFSGDAVTTSMHVEAGVKENNVVANYMIETLTNGTFYLPILNTSSWGEVSVFPNEAPPMEKTLNLSLAENNLTLITISFSSDGDKGLRQMNSSGQLEAVNASELPIEIRFLRRGTNEVLTEMNATNFNPLKALVAGNVDLEIKVTATNVTMKFNNFDMFSAKQPPMFAVIDNNSLGSSTAQTWKFGNFVPSDVYDNVTLIIPYDDSVVNETFGFNMAIPVLYKENPVTAHQFQVDWNISAGYTPANLSDALIEYNDSRYRGYLNSSGVGCSKTDISSVCYMNTTGNQIVMEIPHFSGLTPSVTGVGPTLTSAGTGGGSSTGSSFWTKTTVISEEGFKEGYTTQLAKKQRVRVKVSSGYHYVGITSLTSTTITINVTSETQTATLSIGEEKKFDVTDNGYYDISVLLKSILNTQAEVIIKSISEEVVEEAPEVKEKEEVVKGEEPRAELTEAQAGLTWLWVLIIVVVILAIVWIVLKRRGTSSSSIKKRKK